MEIHLTAKRIKTTPALRDYVQQKMEKAQKYFDHIIWGQAILLVQKRTHSAEFLVHAPGQIFRAVASAADLYSAVDLVSDKIDAQIKKYKERLKNKHKDREEAGPVFAPPPARAWRTNVVRHPVAPMTPEQALEEMERLGQAFRLFQDRDSHQIHLVYRASDDTYTIVQPVKQG